MDWITLIGQGLKAFNNLNDRADQLITYFKKAEEAGWFAKTAEDFKPLMSGPTTKEQKDAAAKAIADDISKL